jgi:aspartyl-tRNA(Asn)/glutamyl-tRNA(Gln) amidotransferase subunit A
MVFQTIHAAAEAIRQGRATPVDLLDACLAAVDRREQQVRAWVFVDRERARDDARRLTDELKRGRDRGPLHGIPIGVKDIFDVFDWPTAAGSNLWANSIARNDAPVVGNLRRAGAVLLGKTVTTQYAGFDPPVTRNPWNLQRTVGGSSSGSAAAVSTLMCLGALGSQTSGGLIQPASYCGIAACKPSYGPSAREGMVPLAPSMDHVGPLGRCVKDVALLLQAMGPTFTPSQMPMAGPPRILRARGFFDERVEPAVRQMLDKVCHALKKRGAAIVDYILPPQFADVVARHRTIMAVEAAAFHGQRLRRHPEDYAPKIRSLVEEGLGCPAPEYMLSQQHQGELIGAFDLATYYEKVVLLTPATTTPAPHADTTGDPAFNSPWSYTGLPTISFPIGELVDGLPLGIQLVAGRYREADLFSAAAWCEEALGAAPLNPPSA